MTVGIGLFGITGVEGYQWFAFVGAAGVTALVLLLGATGRAPQRRSSWFSAGGHVGRAERVSQFLSLLDPDTFAAVRNWAVDRSDAPGSQNFSRSCPSLAWP